MAHHLLEQLDRVHQLLVSVPRGLISDVDGTISEIAASPDEAIVSTQFRGHLRELTKQLDLVAALSGRSAGDARSMVGVDELVYVGNHGLEWWAGGEARYLPSVLPFLPIVAGALGELQSQLKIPGVIIEDKVATVAIHYRRAEDARVARDAIIAALTNSPSANKLRVAKGKMVVELGPPLPLDKGRALVELVRRYRLRSVIYLGDDLTDVDAFLQLRKLRTAGKIDGLAVAVIGVETPPRVVEDADAVLHGVPEVESFLRWMVQELAVGA